jgi:lysophospholipase L1-like esterase
VPLSGYVANLRAIAALTREHGGRVAFLVLPAPMDFDRAPVPPTVSRFREAMKAVAREQGAALLDGPDLFLRSGADLGFFADNVHPTADGHRLLGVGLAQVLLEQGEPPPAR